MRTANGVNRTEGAWLTPVDGTCVRTNSRFAIPFLSFFNWRVKDAILDGEIICADETGRPIFIEMLRGRHPVCFVAFDLLWLNGEDLRPLPLVERKARLKRLLRRRSNHLIAEALAIAGGGHALFTAVEEHDLEGITPTANAIRAGAASSGGRC